MISSSSFLLRLALRVAKNTRETIMTSPTNPHRAKTIPEVTLLARKLLSWEAAPTLLGSPELTTSGISPTVALLIKVGLGVEDTPDVVGVGVGAGTSTRGRSEVVVDTTSDSEEELWLAVSVVGIPAELSVLD